MDQHIEPDIRTDSGADQFFRDQSVMRHGKGKGIVFADLLRAYGTLTETVCFVAAEMEFRNIAEQIQIFADPAFQQIAHAWFAHTITVGIFRHFPQMSVFFVTHHIFAVSECLKQRDRLQSQRPGIRKDLRKFFFCKCFRVNTLRTGLPLDLVFHLPQNSIVSHGCDFFQIRFEKIVPHHQKIHIDVKDLLKFFHRQFNSA